MPKTAKAVIEHNGKYLVLKRAPQSKHWPLHWDFPGGKLDPGETNEQALVREVKEETGMDVQSFTYVDTFVIIDGKTYTQAVFIVVPKTLDVRLSRDHSAYEWMTKEELLHGECTPVVRDYLTSSP